MNLTEEEIIDILITLKNLENYTLTGTRHNRNLNELRIIFVNMLKDNGENSSSV